MNLRRVRRNFERRTKRGYRGVEAALLLQQAVNDAVKRCRDAGKVQFGLRLLRFGLSPGQLRLVQRRDKPDQTLDTKVRSVEEKL